MPGFKLEEETVKFETAKRILLECAYLKVELEESEMPDTRRRKLEKQLAAASAQLNAAREVVEHRAKMEAISRAAAEECLREEVKHFGIRPGRTIEAVKREIKRNARRKENRVSIEKRPR